MNLISARRYETRNFATTKRQNNKTTHKTKITQESEKSVRSELKDKPGNRLETFHRNCNLKCQCNVMPENERRVVAQFHRQCKPHRPNTLVLITPGRGMGSSRGAAGISSYTKFTPVVLPKIITKRNERKK